MPSKHATHHDLMIRGGTLVLPWGEARADVGVRGGRIAAIGALAADSAEATIEAEGLHVLPGLIDSHVHLRDPGDPAVETLATGTEAAVLGGRHDCARHAGDARRRGAGRARRPIGSLRRMMAGP